MNEDLKKDTKEIKTLVQAIYNLHFSGNNQIKKKDLKDRLKAEILIGNNNTR